MGLTAKLSFRIYVQFFVFMNLNNHVCRLFPDVYLCIRVKSGISLHLNCLKYGRRTKKKTRKTFRFQFSGPINCMLLKFPKLGVKTEDSKEKPLTFTKVSHFKR